MNSTKDPHDLHFGTAMKEIEEIAQWFEEEEIDLDLALEKYRRGMELVKRCKEQLQKVENELLLINKEFEEQIISSEE